MKNPNDKAIEVILVDGSDVSSREWSLLKEYAKKLLPNVTDQELIQEIKRKFRI